MRHIALLRGINVGGKNKLPMKDLARLFNEAGCEDVQTLIQSGNVAFTASEAVRKRISDRIEHAIRAEFGFTSPVILRSAEELAAAVAANPFLAAGEPEDLLHMVFLADQPTPAAIAKLDPARSPADRLVVAGRDIYLQLPNGVSGSKFTNDWFDRNLATVSTIRNWRTVLKLQEMALRP